MEAWRWDIAFLGPVVGLLGAVLRPAAEWQAPQVLGCLGIAAPWSAVACSLALLSFAPFYPWAIGIGLIHGSRYLETPSLRRAGPDGAEPRDLKH